MWLKYKVQGEKRVARDEQKAGGRGGQSSGLVWRLVWVPMLRGFCVAGNRRNWRV
jgi:hypothetical protein